MLEASGSHGKHARMNSDNVSHLQEPGEREDADRTLTVSGKDILVRHKDTDRSVVFTTIATVGAS